ncbi:hypothetical protein [Nocardia sp. NPDC051570]|uniref:hypothetical protein n=1 Tax=Nocardia sp. NPDC051570 TaxID=3364324 RepID=UPI0037883A75
MQWWQFALLGAGGGILVEALSIFRCLAIWQADRRTATGRVKGHPPQWKSYVDAPAHLGLLGCRALLGAASAVMFGATGQISGAFVAVALGFAAPSVLAQLGSIPQVAAAVSGAGTPALGVVEAEGEASRSGVRSTTGSRGASVRDVR